MQRKGLLALGSLALPGAALAHGGHAELPAGLHESFHVSPLAALAIIAAAAVLALARS